MAFPELTQADSGLHPECLMQITTEVVRRNLVHQVGNGIRCTLTPNLVIAQPPAQGTRKGHGGRWIDFRLDV